MSDASFLPEDYVAKQAEHRTNVISLTLFVVVMGAVFGAFLVTNSQSTRVKAAQASINTQFQDAASKIEEINELEEQKQRMLNKAELATALLERVPRSILLAELINRMPPNLSLQEFELKSTALKTQGLPKATQSTGRLPSRKSGPERAITREEAMVERTIEAPKYKIEIIMIGVAPTDLEVSQYIAKLNQYPLFQSVILKYTIQEEINDEMMREFRVEMQLDPDADIRSIIPLAIPRGLRNPLNDKQYYNVSDNTVSVDTTEGGN